MPVVDQVQICMQEFWHRYQKYTRNIKLENGATRDIMKPWSYNVTMRKDLHVHTLYVVLTVLKPKGRSSFVHAHTILMYSDYFDVREPKLQASLS